MNTYYASCVPPLPTLVLDISNNNENLPIGLVEHETDKWQIADMYRAAFPHPLTGVAPYVTDVVNVSKFLQMQLWPYCGQQNKCRKKTLVHRPDLAVIHQESVSMRPRNSTPYRVPLFIVEVEGLRMYGGQENRSIKPSRRQRRPWLSYWGHIYCSSIIIDLNIGTLSATLTMARSM